MASEGLPLVASVTFYGNGWTMLKPQSFSKGSHISNILGIWIYTYFYVACALLTYFKKLGFNKIECFLLSRYYHLLQPPYVSNYYYGTSSLAFPWSCCPTIVEPTRSGIFCFLGPLLFSFPCCACFFFILPLTPECPTTHPAVSSCMAAGGSSRFSFFHPNDARVPRQILLFPTRRYCIFALNICM